MASQLLIPLAAPALDSNGNPISGSILEFYDADTLAPKAVYSDYTLATSLGVTQTADAAGRFVDFWVADGQSYRVIWKDSLGSVLKTFNRIQASDGATGHTFFANATGTPSTSNPHWQFYNDASTGFYFATNLIVAGAGGVGSVYIRNNAFEIYPNGVDKRFALSDTSMQLHYDNIAKGTGDGSVHPPNFTWKLPDSAGGGLGSNGGADWPLCSLTANHNTFNIDVGYGAPAGVKTALPFRIYTGNATFASTMRVEITGGAAQAQINISSADLLLGSNGLTFSGAALDLISGIKLALGGRSMSLSNGTGAQAFYVYAANGTANAGIGTDSSAGGVRIIGNGSSLWLFTTGGILQPYTNNTLDIGTSALNVRRVYSTNIYSGANQVLGARDTGWTADTGTAKKTANATYTGTAEATYTQATIQALMDKVRDTTQTVKALKDALITHGIIGA